MSRYCPMSLNMVMGYAARYRMPGKEARRKAVNIEQRILSKECRIIVHYLK